MKLIRRKILLEDLISRNLDSTYGHLTASTINIKIPLYQTMDDMGMYTDISFISETENESESVDYSILINKLTTSGITFPFMTGATSTEQTPTGFTKNIRLDGSTVDDWFKSGGKVTGKTDSKVEIVRSYDKNNPFITSFDVEVESYINYVGSLIDGRTRVTFLGDSTGYTVDANLDSDIGTPNQSTGILYRDNPINREVVNDLHGIGLKIKTEVIGDTEFSFSSEGWNQTNSSLSALTKEEYLLGITSPPEVQSDVFIDRGSTTVFDRHLRLSEIEGLDHLDRYGNGFYNITKQF